MRISYGLLEVKDVVIRGSTHYAYLSQSVSCELPLGAVDQEPHLLGFVDSLALRKLYYRIPTRTTQEDFELLLTSYPDARIIRVLDHEPILTPEQKVRVEKGVIDVLEIAETQLIKNSDGTVYIDRFGLMVFAQNRLCLSGVLNDQDYRWFGELSGAELAQEIVEPQLIGKHEKQRT